MEYLGQRNEICRRLCLLLALRAGQSTYHIQRISAISPKLSARHSPLTGRRSLVASEGEELKYDEERQAMVGGGLFGPGARSFTCDTDSAPEALVAFYGIEFIRAPRFLLVHVVSTRATSTAPAVRVRAGSKSW